MFAAVIRKLAVATAAAVITLTSQAGDANAGKVPIPCTGEKLVPMSDAVQLPGSDRKVGLGYLYTGCFSGHFVVHAGKDGQYYNPEKNAAVKTMVDLMLSASAAQNGGVAPSPPGILWGLWNYPGKFWAEWVWVVMIVCVGVAIAKTETTPRRNGTPDGGHPSEPVPTPPQASPSPSATPSRRAPRNLQTAMAAPGFGKRA